jgi:hypothetical protein
MASRVTRITGERAIEKLMQCRGYCFTVVELQAVEQAALNKRVEIGIANLDIDAEEPAGSSVAAPALTDRCRR